MKVLVTGAAGFIGFHLVMKLIEKKDFVVVGLDNINDYYNVKLKYDRMYVSGIFKEDIQWNKKTLSRKIKNYSFYQINLEDSENLNLIFKVEKFDIVYNLAAQAGVRYSLKNPGAYIKSNIMGFSNLLEECKNHEIAHLIYASSSSVYGLNRKMPLSTMDNVDHPMSIYAASKKSNELLAHSYSHLYNLPTTGLRFFTVYGPWGRPDMAIYIFTKAILKGLPIDVYNFGNMMRDFTYIDDIIDGLLLFLNNVPSGIIIDENENYNPNYSSAPYVIYNIGNSKPVNLLHFIKEIEKQLGIVCKKNMMPLQEGDVIDTYADLGNQLKGMGYKPKINIEKGISEYVSWFKKYYNI